MSLQATEATVVTLNDDMSVLRFVCLLCCELYFLLKLTALHVTLCISVSQRGAGGRGAGAERRCCEGCARREVSSRWPSDWRTLDGRRVSHYRFKRALFSLLVREQSNVFCVPYTRAAQLIVIMISASLDLLSIIICDPGAQKQS